MTAKLMVAMVSAAVAYLIVTSAGAAILSVANQLALALAR